MRQRRRAERSRLAERSASVSPADRRVTERIQQRAILAIAGIVALVVLALLLAGWYFGAYQPPRKVIAEIEGQTLRLGDAVPYTILESTLSGSLDPRQGINTYVRDAIFLARADDLGVEITDADVQAELVARFEAPSDDPDAEPPAALSADGQDAFETYLDIVEVDEDAYRQWLQGQLYWAALLGHFQDELPDTTSQVFLNWILAENSVTVVEAYDRVVAGETFADVAADLNVETTFSDETGAVGWVPEEIFAEFDTILFAEDLVLNEPIGPLDSTIGSIVLMVSEGPEDREIEESRAVLLASTHFQEWMDVQTDELLPALPFTTDDMTWVLNRLR